MNIILSDLQQLSQFTKKKYFLCKDKDHEHIKYAENLCLSLIENKTQSILKKLNINIFEVIFVNSKPFLQYSKKFINKKNNYYNTNELSCVLLLNLILKGKRLQVVSLREENGFYSFDLPEQIIFEMSGDLSNYPLLCRAQKKIQKTLKKNIFDVNKQTAYINEFLQKYNINIIKNYISAAINDFSFIVKFNEGMFYQNITFKGTGISKDVVIGIYNEERYRKFIDLSEQNECNAFISLYGMTFKGLSFNDFYSINGIFNMQMNRELDTLKQESSREVFNLISNENEDEIIIRLEQMGETLQKIQLLQLNLYEHKVRENLSLYIGLADIGMVFSRLYFKNMSSKLKKSIATAQRLSEYSTVVNFYKSVFKSEIIRDFKENEYYQSALKFSTNIKDKEFASDLDI